MVFDVFINGPVIVREDRKRDQWSTNDTKKELNLSVSATKKNSRGGRRRRFFIVRLNPTLDILPRAVAVLVGDKHLFRDGNFQHRLQPIFTIKIGTKFPHQKAKSDRDFGL